MSYASVFPDADLQRRLKMIVDHDRKTRRLLNRMWIEIKVPQRRFRAPHESGGLSA